MDNLTPIYPLGQGSVSTTPTTGNILHLDDDSLLDPPTAREVRCMWCGQSGWYKSYRLKLEGDCPPCGGYGEGFPSELESWDEDEVDRYLINQLLTAKKINKAAAEELRKVIRG